MGKSKATKPTRSQKILMDKSGLIVRNWLVLRETDSELKLVSRVTGRSRTNQKKSVDPARSAPMPYGRILKYHT